MPLVNAGQRVTAALLSEDYAQGDGSSITVTQAAATDITAAWSIPANDAAVNTVYRLTTGGNGTWGSTQQILNFQIKVGANAYNTPQIGATEFPISTSIRWKVVSVILIQTTGVSGTMFSEMSVYVSVNATTWLSSGPNANNTVAGTSSGNAQAINTTIANNWTVQAWWGSTTGAPTLSSHGSLFEKLGG